MFRTAVLSLSLLFAASAGLRAETVVHTRTLGPEDFTPEAMRKELGKCVDKAIRMLSGEEPLKLYEVESAATWVEAQTAAAAYGKAGPRERGARGFLGTARCDALEKACLAALDSSSEDVRATARRILARTLGSRVREDAWAEEVREAMEGFARTGIFPLSVDELFSLAENLAYLGNPVGKAVLLDVLAAESRPVVLAQRAVLAMKALGEPLPDGLLAKLLRSPETRIARTAFDSVPGAWRTPLAVDAAQAQLERLWQKYDRDGSLSRDERYLLSDAGFVLVSALREGTLSGSNGTAAAAKAAARHFVECDDRDLQEQAALLFGELAGEEDEEILVAMMSSRSERLRSRGAAGLMRCPVGTIERHLPRLRELQDDPAWEVRLQAANCLQKLANAGLVPADSFVSPMKMAGFEEPN
jgi:hypothetical protein